MTTLAEGKPAPAGKGMHELSTPTDVAGAAVAVHWPSRSWSKRARLTATGVGKAEGVGGGVGAVTAPQDTVKLTLEGRPRSAMQTPVGTSGGGAKTSVSQPASA